MDLIFGEVGSVWDDYAVVICWKSPNKCNKSPENLGTTFEPLDTRKFLLLLHPICA